MSNNELGHILCEAALIGAVEKVVSLLKDGADPNYVSGEGRRTPMHYAASRTDAHLCQLLIDAGGSVSARDREDTTPLHLAARDRGGDSAIRTLAEAGADINAKDSEGWTPLHQAASRGGLANCRALVDLGADIFAKDMEGRMPQQVAPKTRSGAEIEEMLAAEMLRADMDKEIRKVETTKGPRTASERGGGL